MKLTFEDGLTIAQNLGAIEAVLERLSTGNMGESEQADVVILQGRVVAITNALGLTPNRSK